MSFAHGSRFGGHALYVKDNRLHYVYNFVGMREQTVVATEDLPTGENLILSASFDKEARTARRRHRECVSLYHGEEKVGEARIRTQPGKFMLAGEGLCVGRDSGSSASPTTTRRRPRRHSRAAPIKRVAVDVSGEPYRRPRA